MSNSKRAVLLIAMLFVTGGTGSASNGEPLSRTPYHQAATALSVELEGPNAISANSVCYWQAHAWGGSGTYNYVWSGFSWYYDYGATILGQLDAWGSPTYVEVTVWDGTGAYASSGKWVQINNYGSCN